MKQIPQQKTVIIDKLYITDQDLRHVVASNIDSVNQYFEHQLKLDDIIDDALYSYYVADFDMRLTTGGMAYFAHSSRWHAHSLHYIEFGLATMQAWQACALLEQVADTIINNIGIINFEHFCAASFDVHHHIAHTLNRFNKEIKKIEPLKKINQNWLINHPKLTLIHPHKFRTLLRSHAVVTTTTSLHEKYIHALCEQYGTPLIAIMGHDAAAQTTGYNYQILTQDGVFLACIGSTLASLYQLNDNTPLCSIYYNQ